MVGMSMNTSQTNLSVALQYPAEELHISCNTSSEFSGLRTESGLKLHFDLQTFYRLRMYDVLRSPLLLIEPISIPSGIYDLGGAIDELNFGLDMIVTNKGERKEIIYRNEDGHTRGILSSFFLTSLQVAQNFMNGVRYIYLSLGSSSFSTEELKEYDSSRHRVREDFLNVGSAYTWSTMSIMIFNILFFVTKPHLNVGKVHGSRYVNNYTVEQDLTQIL